jgi:predicted N-acyltransferase
MADIQAASWDALFDPGYPFTRHAYLHALEASGSVSPQLGWTPCHTVLEDDAGQVVAAAPLYLKGHSWGEFVFDFSWAEAAQRGGLAYYPKLLTAVPFTPASGPRIGGRSATDKAALLQALLQLPGQSNASSWHGLFMPQDVAQNAAALGAIQRHDVQFQWHNAATPYADFSQFLGALQGEKRKKILQERRKISEAGLRFETLPAEQFDEDQWQRLYALYANTYEERGQPPYLSLAFFTDFVAQPGSPFRVTVAYEGETLVAMALLVQGDDTLYGRHWGAAERYSGLHFETCYYQGLDYCIRQGLTRYDAGAQGEHKLARGFDPVMTHSLHQFADPRLGDAVANAMRRERRLVQARFAELQSRSAYKKVAAE